MRIRLPLKWWVVVVVCLATVGCSEEENSQNEPTSTNDTQVEDSVTSDGADSESDSISSSCGDDVVGDGEECDDGKANSDELADACRTNCKEASCGDGVIDIRLNETCDDGNTIDDDACNNLCHLSSCGDGVLQSGEVCDDGLDNSDTRPNACRTNCTVARCGDSAADSGEDCDDGNDFIDDACIDCVTARCGDGVMRQNVETCDDGNAAALDGCSDQCRVELGFVCQGQPSACTISCGDGITVGAEQCDDGNNLNEDYCASDCLSITGQCGDGMIQNNEQCDDGNLTPGDYCSPVCNTSGFCGDGVIQTPMNELCDDGNTLSGDGCLGSCASLEPGWTCSTTSPTSCSPVVCSENHYVQNNACVICPPGTTNASGDNAFGPNTLCDTTICLANQHVQNNDCVSCPPGTTNAAGDDATGSDTTCDAILCTTNQYVQNNTCMNCAPGTTNAAGDNAIGSNTTCDTVFCAVDQYVQNNACVACPFAMINDAGDDASGSDTACENEPCYLALGVFCSEFEQAYVKASNSGVSAFGYSVALSGDTLAVGNINSVYVFTRSGTTWTQQAHLTASNAAANDRFGFSVALSGDTLAVGANEEDSNATGINGNQADNSASESGAVYVFTRSGTTWTQQAYIKASNTNSSDKFGGSVTLSGNTLAVGASVEASNATGINGNQADNSAAESGAVYIFTRSGTTWTQQAYLKPSNTNSGDQFGYSITLDTDTLAVGAPGEDSSATGINGNQADNSASQSGAVYVFTRSGTTWTQQAYIKASNTGGGDFFGSPVVLSGNTLAVGALQEDSNAVGINGNQADNSASESGAVYVFTRSGTTWTQQAYIKASNTAADDFFGFSVALSGNALAIGAISEDSNATGINGDQVNSNATNSGAVYLFTRSGTAWTQQAYIKASNADALDEFGYSVTLSGNTLAVGAPGEASNATGINGNQADNSVDGRGAVYIRKIAP